MNILSKFGQIVDQPTAVPQWKRLTAAVPNFILAIAYVIAWIGDVYILEFMGLSQKILLAIPQAEFLSIHSGAFLGFIVLIAASGIIGRLIKLIAFFGLLSLYIFLAKTEGMHVVMLFLPLIITTYMGQLLSNAPMTEKLELGLRLFINIIVFIIAVAISDLPPGVDEWDNNNEGLVFGSIYFFLLASIEYSNLYQGKIIPPILKLINIVSTRIIPATSNDDRNIFKKK